MLDVENLSYAYPDGHEALHGVSLTVHEGEKLALVPCDVLHDCCAFRRN